MISNDKPTRCVDPVMKFCQECRWGWTAYPEWVETYSDLEGCSFECGCMLGFDKGRPEDEPTEEELKEFGEWCDSVRNMQEDTMSVLKDCKDRCFNDIDKAIDYIKAHKYCIHIILYHCNENVLYRMIDSLYNDIKEHNKGLSLDEQIRPTYPYYFRDIDGCLGVQCAEISMNFYEATTHLTPLFYGGYKNDVLDLHDKEML